MNHIDTPKNDREKIRLTIERTNRVVTEMSQKIGKLCVYTA